MKLAKIILIGTLGLGSLAFMGNSINRESIQRAEKQQEHRYLCPMMETEDINEMRERHMQCYDVCMERGKSNNEEHPMYRCCMRQKIKI